MLPNGQQNFPGPVAREVKSAIQEINPYQLDSAVNTYPLDTDLSVGQCYPTLSNRS